MKHIAFIAQKANLLNGDRDRALLNSLLHFNRAVVLDIDADRLKFFAKVKMAMWGSFNVVLELNLRESEYL